MGPVRIQGGLAWVMSRWSNSFQEPDGIVILVEVNE